MKIETTNYRVCPDCADIVVQGYCDALDDTQAHHARCNHIDSMLPDGAYWLGSWQVDESDPDWFERCECCGHNGTDRTVQSAVNVPDDASVDDDYESAHAAEIAELDDSD